MLPNRKSDPVFAGTATACLWVLGPSADLLELPPWAETLSEWPPWGAGPLEQKHPLEKPPWEVDLSEQPPEATWGVVPELRPGPLR